MAAKSSSLAAFSYDASAASGIGNISISAEQTIIHTTDISTGARSFILGNRGVTAQIEMFYDQGDACMAKVEADANSGANSKAVVITLSTGMTYTGSAFVQSFNATASTNEVIRASFTIQFTGTVTIA